MTALTVRGTLRQRRYPAERARKNETPWERVLRRIEEDAATGCWVFTGTLQSTGYAQLTIGGRSGFYIHRIAYEEFVGHIPDGLQIDHLCRNRACCNPTHLEVVTAQVNTLRGTSFAARHAAQTRCVNDHPFDDDNTYTFRGHRRCRVCQRVAQAAWVAAHPEGSDPEAPVIRAWAKRNGLRVGKRGAIPRAVRQAYVAAHEEAVA